MTFLLLLRAAHIFISIKGVQNALKCIKQIEIYYHLNVNANANGVRYVRILLHIRQDPAKYLIYASTHTSRWNEQNLHPFISMVFSFFFCFSRFCLFVTLYGCEQLVCL